MEDDYEFKLDYFDKIHIDIIEKNENIGYLCAWAKANGTYPYHAAISIGCIKSIALEKFWQTNDNKLFPYPDTNLSASQLKDYKKIEKYGQVGLSLGIIKAGYDLKDISDYYRSEFKLPPQKIVSFGNPKKK